MLSGLVSSGLVWSGLVWSGVVWCGLVWCCLVLSTCTLRHQISYHFPVQSVRLLACLLGGGVGEAIGLQQATSTSQAVDSADITAMLMTVSACSNNSVKAAVMHLLAELLFYEVLTIFASKLPQRWLQ